MCASDRSYRRFDEHQELGLVSRRFNTPEEVFNKCLDLLPSQKTRDYLPDITVVGDKLSKDCNGYVLTKLPIDDPRALLLGAITNCCQLIGGNAEQCAVDGWSRTHNGFYVLLKAKQNSPSLPPIKKGGRIDYENYEIVGQSYAWLSRQGNLVFDSMENLRSADNDIAVKLLTEFAHHVIHESGSTIFRVCIGAGGRTPDSLRKRGHAQYTETMLEGIPYGDANKQIEINSVDHHPILKKKLQLNQVVDNICGLSSTQKALLMKSAVPSFQFIEVLQLANNEASIFNRYIRTALNNESSLPEMLLTVVALYCSVPQSMVEKILAIILDQYTQKDDLFILPSAEPFKVEVVAQEELDDEESESSDSSEETEELEEGQEGEEEDNPWDDEPAQVHLEIPKDFTSIALEAAGFLRELEENPLSDAEINFKAVKKLIALLDYVNANQARFQASYEFYNALKSLQIFCAYHDNNLAQKKIEEIVLFFQNDIDLFLKLLEIPVELFSETERNVVFSKMNEQFFSSLTTIEHVTALLRLSTEQFSKNQRAHIFNTVSDSVFMNVRGFSLKTLFQLSIDQLSPSQRDHILTKMNPCSITGNDLKILFQLSPEKLSLSQKEIILTKINPSSITGHDLTILFQLPPEQLSSDQKEIILTKINPSSITGNHLITLFQLPLEQLSSEQREIILATMKPSSITANDLIILFQLPLEQLSSKQRDAILSKIDPNSFSLENLLNLLQFSVDQFSAEQRNYILSGLNHKFFHGVINETLMQLFQLSTEKLSPSWRDRILSGIRDDFSFYFSPENVLNLLKLSTDQLSESQRDFILTRRNSSYFFANRDIVNLLQSMVDIFTEDQIDIVLSKLSDIFYSADDFSYIKAIMLFPSDKLSDEKKDKFFRSMPDLCYQNKTMFILINLEALHSFLSPRQLEYLLSDKIKITSRDMYQFLKESQYISLNRLEESDVFLILKNFLSKNVIGFENLIQFIECLPLSEDSFNLIMEKLDVTTVKNDHQDFLFRLLSIELNKLPEARRLLILDKLEKDISYIISNLYSRDFEKLFNLPTEKLTSNLRQKIIEKVLASNVNIEKLCYLLSLDEEKLSRKHRQEIWDKAIPRLTDMISSTSDLRTLLSLDEGHLSHEMKETIWIALERKSFIIEIDCPQDLFKLSLAQFPNERRHAIFESLKENISRLSFFDAFRLLSLPDESFSQDQKAFIWKHAIEASLTSPEILETIRGKDLYELFVLSLENFSSENRDKIFDAIEKNLETVIFKNFLDLKTFNLFQLSLEQFSLRQRAIFSLAVFMSIESFNRSYARKQELLLDLFDPEKIGMLNIETLKYLFYKLPEDKKCNIFEDDKILSKVILSKNDLDTLIKFLANESVDTAKHVFYLTANKLFITETYEEMYPSTTSILKEAKLDVNAKDFLFDFLNLESKKLPVKHRQIIWNMIRPNLANRIIEFSDLEKLLSLDEKQLPPEIREEIWTALEKKSFRLEVIFPEKLFALDFRLFPDIRRQQIFNANKEKLSEFRYIAPLFALSDDQFTADQREFIWKKTIEEKASSQNGLKEIRGMDLYAIFSLPLEKFSSEKRIYIFDAIEKNLGQLKFNNLIDRALPKFFELSLEKLSASQRKKYIYFIFMSIESFDQLPRDNQKKLCHLFDQVKTNMPSIELFQYLFDKLPESKKDSIFNYEILSKVVRTMKDLDQIVAFLAPKSVDAARRVFYSLSYNLGNSKSYDAYYSSKDHDASYSPAGFFNPASNPLTQPLANESVTKAIIPKPGGNKEED